MLHKSQILALILAAFVVGVFAASLFDISTVCLLTVTVLAVAVAAVGASPKFWNNTINGRLRRRIFFTVITCVLVVVVGAWRFNTVHDAESILGDLTEINVIAVRGYVDGDFSRAARDGRFSFRAVEAIVDGAVRAIDERVLVIGEPFPEYRPGDQLIISGTLKLPENFGDFDYVSYLRKDGVRMTIRVADISIDTNTLSQSPVRTVRLWAYRVVFAVRGRFEVALARSIAEPNASFISGILLGAKKDIPDDLREAFNRTSTSHILAISGYNITIIAQNIMWVLLFWIRRRRAFWFSVAAVLVFTIMTGASASVVRAAVMGLLALFASSYGRLSDARNSLLMAGAVMVAVNPEILRFDIGFQLSFLAVLGMIYIVPILEYVLRGIPIASELKTTVATTVSAQLAVAPLLAYYFGSVSLAALPANVLVLPLIPFLMALGFIAGLIGVLVPILGTGVGALAWAVSAYQLQVIRWLAMLPWAAVSINVSIMIVAAVYTVMGATVVGLSRKVQTAMECRSVI